MNHLRQQSPKKDELFVNIVLLSYRMFTTPENLFAWLVKRYDGPNPQDPNKSTYQERVLEFLKLWIETTDDFNNKESPLFKCEKNKVG